jgi:hypothetical protein
MTEASKVVEYIRSLPKEKLQSLTYEDLLNAGIDVKKLPPKELVSIAKELRNLGLGYKRIGRILDIPVSTIYRCISKFRLEPKEVKVEPVKTGKEVQEYAIFTAKLTKFYILFTLITACRDALDLIDDLLRDLGFKPKT